MACDPNIVAPNSETGAAVVSDSHLESQDAQSALAKMKADMHAALNDPQRTSGRGEGGRASTSSNRCVATTTDEAGDKVLDDTQISRVIEMAWEDRTPFDAIEHIYGLNEAEVIKLMRHTLKPSSFRLWRQRVSNRATKHQAKRSFGVGRAYCKTQYKPR